MEIFNKGLKMQSKKSIPSKGSLLTDCVCFGKYKMSSIYLDLLQTPPLSPPPTAPQSLSIWLCLSDKSGIKGKSY